MAQVYKPTSDSPLVRLMVLETDKPHPDTASERGSFGQIVHHHFSKAGEAHHPPLAVETDQVFVVTEQGGQMPKKEEFEGYHGLLITGSMFDAHGNNQWILDLLTLLKGKAHSSHGPHHKIDTETLTSLQNYGYLGQISTSQASASGTNSSPAFSGVKSPRQPLKTGNLATAK